MAKLTTVTLETDGTRDFVCLPDGVRYILGTTSVLRLVAELVKDRRMKRRALEEFNKKGKAVVTLDTERMFEYLAPKPLRKGASVSSLIQPQKRAQTSEEGTMTDIKLLDTRIAHLENTVREMNARVASGGRVSRDLFRNLHQAAIHLKDYGDQSKNQAYYNLGAPKVDTMEDPGAWTPPASVTHPAGKTASRNMKIAEQTLMLIAEASDQVEAKKESGEEFNDVQAQDDLHTLAQQVNEALAGGDIESEETTQQLAKAARQVARIHDIFSR